MYFKKAIATSFIAILLLFSITGCKGDTKNNSSGVITKEPTLVSANETKTWPGADFVVTINNEKEIEKTQIKVLIGGISAEVESCINNQVRIKTPNGIKAGAQSITATIDGKDCTGSLTIEVVSPVITTINTYTTGNSLGIDMANIEDKADTVKVYLNNNELTYSYLSDLGAAGKYSIVVDLPQGTQNGEVYVIYGANKSNSMTFIME